MYHPHNYNMRYLYLIVFLLFLFLLPHLTVITYTLHCATMMSSLPGSCDLVFFFSRLSVHAGLFMFCKCVY